MTQNEYEVLYEAGEFPPFLVAKGRPLDPEPPELPTQGRFGKATSSAGRMPHLPVQA